MIKIFLFVLMKYIKRFLCGRYNLSVQRQFTSNLMNMLL